jgi:hypothetical protein
LKQVRKSRRCSDAREVDVFSLRRIAAHEVGSFGAGRRALDLGEGLRLARGLRLVRLTQGDEFAHG